MLSQLHQLSVAYVDVSPEGLKWQLGLSARDALRVDEFEVGEVTVQLRLLGMSHQVVLLRNSEMIFSETVACADTGHALPEQWSDDGYEFSSEVARYESDTFTDAVREITNRVSVNDNVLAAAFPGSPLAITAIEFTGKAAQPAWITWHAYPQSKAIVRTESAYRLGAA